MMNVGGLTDFGAGVSREFEELKKTIISLKYGVVKRVLKEKLFCNNFTVSNLGDSISIHCIEYPVHIGIFSNYVTLDIIGNKVEYHYDEHVFLTLDEFIEDNIKEKCAEKYQSLIREKKLIRITDETR